MLSYRDDYLHQVLAVWAATAGFWQTLVTLAPEALHAEAALAAQLVVSGHRRVARAFFGWPAD